MPPPKPPSNITQTTEMKLGPEQKKVFNLAMPSIEEYAASTPTVFEGSGVVDFSPEEIAGQQYYTGVAAPTAAGLSQQAAYSNSLMMDPDFMLNPNQYVKGAADAVTQQTTQNLMENILPGIRSGATMQGGPYSGGSTRQGIGEGKAIGDTSTSISNAIADMYFKNYQTGLAGMSGAIDRNQSVMAQQLMPADIMSSVGAQRRSMEQAKLDEQIRKFYAQQDLPLLKSQQLLNLISGMPGGIGTSTVSGAQPSANPLMQIGGMGLSLLGMLGGGGGGGGMGAALPLLLK